jgi:DHA2 family multidrug resistance protein
MELYDLFYKWVPFYLRLPVLLIWFFVILTANGVFSGNITDIFSSLGVYTEPYTQASNALFIGMALGLMLHVRLKMRLTNKTLLMGGFTVMLLMNIICATTKEPALAIAACLLIGFAKISALIEVYIIWIGIWSKNFDTSRVYPFVYFCALCGLYFVTWVTAQLAYVYSWRYAYIVVIIMLLICLLLALIFAENHPLKRRVPLYQMDYPALLLLTSSMLLLNYAIVNGKVEDWLESKKIITAFTGAAVTLLMFIWRELTARHPFFDLQLLRRRNVVIGLFYFLLLAIFTPGIFQTAFSASILHYETPTNMELSMFVSPGVLIGSFLCYVWYYKKFNEDLLIFLGFLALVSYHILMYNNFSNEFNMEQFWLPSLLKGFGTVVVYVAVGLFLTRNLQLTKVMGAAGIMIMFRSFLGSATSSAIYTYCLYTFRIKRFEYLAGLTDGASPAVKEHGTVLNYYRTLQEQAILTAAKQFTGYIIIIGLILLTALLIKYVYHKMMNKFAA